jgi:hypothetical protein
MKDKISKKKNRRLRARAFRNNSPSNTYKTSISITETIDIGFKTVYPALEERDVKKETVLNQKRWRLSRKSKKNKIQCP